MFRITKKTEYALKAVFHLSFSRGYCTTQEIAKSQEIPVAFLKKIIQVLRTSGVVTSIKGQKGGVALKISPENLTVREVIETVDGPLCISDSLLAKDGGDGKGLSIDPLGGIWQKCQTTLLDILNSHKFSDLVASYKEKVRLNDMEGVPTFSTSTTFGLLPA